MCEFSHLHCHTQYSLLDGAARIKRLVAKAGEMQMPGIAITDHGNLFGVPEFYTSARRAGVVPIIGCEFYVTPSGMHDKSDRTRYHQVLLAKSEEGYQNLIKLSSLSYTDGYYYKPRLDREALRTYSGGLIATTCCLQGEVLQTILRKGEDEARKVFEDYLDIFGDDYYVEIQDHGIPDQKKCNVVLLKWAREYNVKVIATNDVHYVEQADSEAQDVLLCLQTGKDYHDPNRMRFENDQFFLKTQDEMMRALRDLDEKVAQTALVNTQEIVDKCGFELSMGKLLMPHYPIPPAFNNDMDAYLKALSIEGARPRYGDPLPQHVVERLEYELQIIKTMGYAGYFLIVQDFTTAARELGVSVGPGRGSAAGSAVAYCLGITNIDPLHYDLLFERFLNPERVSMPDIDIDFDDRGRGKVIDYVVDKYGRESVCQIITFGTMGARSVIRDVSRVLGIPLTEADRIAKLIPEGAKVNLASAMDDVPEFKALTQSPDAQIRKLMHYAQVLEGSARHTGVHAAGVIIAPGDVSNYVPISVAKKKDEEIITTQYDGNWVEAFGLLKMDFLGLKTLTVLKDALDLIKRNHGVEIDLDEVPLDDEKTYELFQRGETVSVFQFESSGMREWMRKLKPTNIDDLIAMNALYRPGPMDLIPNYIDRKHGREQVDYPHPMLEKVLEPTYGIPVYQEQVMQMAQVMGGYSLGGADLLRRCLTGDTLILHADTGQRVRMDEVEPGMPVWSMGPDYRLRRVVVQERMDNGTMPVYRLRTRSGRTLRLTAEHPLCTLTGWRHLSDLSPGDAIAVPTIVPTAGAATPSDARVRVLAYLLGDGNTRCKGGRANAFFYNSDPEVLDAYTAAIHKLGAGTRRCTHQDTGVVTVTCHTPGHTVNPITDLVEEADLVHLAHEKRIPAEVFSYAPRALRLFLGTLWSTDGSIEKTRIPYSTSSPDLLDDLAHLLLRLGIVTMRRTRTTTHRDNHELLITDQRDVLRFAEMLGPHLCTKKRVALEALVRRVRKRRRSHSIYNIPADVGHLVREAKYASGLSWSAAGERVGVPGNNLSAGLNFKTPRRALARHRVQLLGTAFGDAHLCALAEADVLWDPIVAIEPDGEAPVYDLAVPPFANFVAADLLVHNSMGKKKVKEMEKQRVIFVEGAVERGVDAKTADEVFDMMAKFAGYGFNKCVVARTEVMDATTGERTTVGDLFHTRQPLTIHALSDDGALVPRKVEDVVWNGVKPIFELRTQLGKRIVATGNHPFRTLGGWTNLEDLRPGDRIAAPRKLDVPTTKTWPKHELITLAGLIAEGNTCHPSCLYFYSNDRRQIDDFAAAVQHFPDTHARIDQRSDGRLEVYVNTGRDTRFQPGQTPWNAGGGVAEVEAPARSDAFVWADTLGLLGKKATEKFVPAEVFTLCDDDVALFLGRLWAGDGFIANMNQFTSYYATSSPQLARDVQTLLLRLGIVSRIHEKQFRYRGTLRAGYTVHLLGEGSAERFVQYLGPHLLGPEEALAHLERHLATTDRDRTSKDTIPAEIRTWVDAERQAAGLTWKALGEATGVSIREFYGKGSRGKRGFRRSTIAKLATFFASERLQTAVASEVFWDEITYITPLGHEDTYDLTVAEDHNFVADGLIVHNSHAAAYSVVAYHTAYLKANYTPEFMAAAMTNEMGDTKKLSIVLEEARHLGIELLPPCVNHSQAHFDATGDDKVRFGLGAIKGVGLGAIEAIIKSRDKNGPFKTIFGLTKELDLKAVNKKALESLARVGALDALEGHRGQLIAAVDLSVQYAQKTQADKAAGQNSLFGALMGGGGMDIEPSLPMMDPVPRGKILKEERELIGFYVSGHPLEQYAAEAKAFATLEIGRVTEEDVQPVGGDGQAYGRDNRPVHRVFGIVTDIQRRTTKSGKPMMFAEFEDLTGQAELICFASVLDRVQHYLQVDEIVMVEGGVEFRGGSIKIIVNDVQPMWKVREQRIKSIIVRVDMANLAKDLVEQFAELCADNRGHAKLYFDVYAEDLPQPQRIRSRNYVLDPSNDLMRGLHQLFGRNNVVLAGEE